MDIFLSILCLLLAPLSDTQLHLHMLLFYFSLFSVIYFTIRNLTFTGFLHVPGGARKDTQHPPSYLLPPEQGLSDLVQLVFGPVAKNSVKFGCVCQWLFSQKKQDLHKGSTGGLAEQCWCEAEAGLATRFSWDCGLLWRPKNDWGSQSSKEKCRTGHYQEWSLLPIRLFASQAAKKCP